MRWFCYGFLWCAIACSGTLAGDGVDAGPRGGAGGDRSDQVTGGTGAMPGSGGRSAGEAGMASGAGGGSAGTGGDSGDRDAGAGTGGGEGGGGSDSPLPRPEGTVAAFVAMSHGAWTATTCDSGQTWHTHQASAERDDHGPYSGFGGLAYGHGVFVMGTGWAPSAGHLFVSDNAVDWTELKGASLGLDGQQTIPTYVGAVMFDGDAFLSVGARHFQSADGQRWTEVEVALPPGTDQVRQGRGFAGRWVISAENATVGNFVVTSSGDLTAWTTSDDSFASSCASRIQSRGDLVMKGRVLLIGADNGACRSEDGGRSWEATDLRSEARGLFTDGRTFFALSGTQLLRSSDGAQWTEAHDFGSAVGRGAYVDDVYLVIAPDGARVFRSEDGEDWAEVSAPDPLPGTAMLDFQAGYVTPDSRCGAVP